MEIPSFFGMFGIIILTENRLFCRIYVCEKNEMGECKMTGNYYNNYPEQDYDIDNYEDFKIKKVKFNYVMLIASVLAGIVFFVLGEVIRAAMEEHMPAPFMVGIYFWAFGICLAVGLFAAHVVMGTFSQFQKPLLVLLTLILSLSGGMLFELLYELGGSQIDIKEADIIFAIDNSGSMEENDPEQLRVEAIEEIIDGSDSDFRYAVYSFGDSVEMIRNMADQSEGTGSLQRTPNGGTPIVGVLEQIERDIDSKQFQLGRNTKIVLLTDGYATDNGMFFHNAINRPLKYFAKKNISINAVGLGNVDEVLMNQMADKTGGVFIMADDVSQLAEAMKTASTTYKERNLLGFRPALNLGWFYGLMRIVFITLLGTALLFLKLGIVGNRESQEVILLFTIGGSLLAGLFMEFGINAFSISPGVVRFVSIILMTLTPSYAVREYSMSEYGSGAMIG